MVFFSDINSCWRETFEKVFKLEYMSYNVRLERSDWKNGLNMNFLREKSIEMSYNQSPIKDEIQELNCGLMMSFFLNNHITIPVTSPPSGMMNRTRN